MAKYATRTCVECGLRAPQPQMKQIERYVEVAKGKDSMSASTVAGLLFGDKKSANKAKSVIFNSGQRTYKRKVKSWMCPDCAKRNAGPSKLGSFFAYLIGGIIGLIVLLFLSA